MASLPIALPQQDAGDACWSFLQTKKVLMAARGHDCSVSSHPDPLAKGQRLCLSWVPSTERPHATVSLRASRNYVLELTLRSTGDLQFSYSGCGIDTRQTLRTITNGPALERELNALFFEFETISRFTHHEWFVAPPKSKGTGWGRRLT